ncbi:MAG: alginate lyase family protein, partial [Anaerolineae bacterium]|nr:alginate lyase family protein [Anaerolineae bacterium]
VWELNRFHHAVALGLAWQLIGDDRYPTAFVSQVSDWLTANPVGRGINWACAMEVAVRAVNWLFACALMQEALPAEFERVLLGALLTHGHYIRANLELALVTTNHYLADLCGLAVLGLALPGAEPDRWRRFALRELAREVAFQVYPDGADFEASTSYHRLAVELFDLPARLAQHTGAPVPPILTEQLPLMRAFSAAVTRPDGTLPLIGDSDDGHLLPSLSALPSSTSTSTPFPHAGIYVMRHADRYLICDCGPNGQRGNGGHAHNDTLSFELYAGRSWIVDPGTYTYTGDLDAYNWFRSTAAHNTLVVDGEEQARFDPHEPFLLAPDAQPTVRRWESTPDYDLLDAEHTGYHRL